MKKETEMGKIIQFNLPDQAATGNVGFDTPVKRDNPPDLVDGINWATRTFDSRQTGLGQDDPPPRRQKEPIFGLRAHLERPGYILIGWHVFWTSGHDGTPFDRAYNVYWMPKTGPRWVHYDFTTVTDVLCCSPFYRTSRTKVRYWLNHHNTDYAALLAPELLEYGPDLRPAYLDKLASTQVS
jgi:hypothetical protein